MRHAFMVCCMREGKGKVAEGGGWSGGGEGGEKRASLCSCAARATTAGINAKMAVSRPRSKPRAEFYRLIPLLLPSYATRRT